VGGETRTARHDAEAGPVLRRLRATLAGDRHRTFRTAGAVALAAVLGSTLVRVLHNIPFDPMAVPPAIRTLTTIGTPVVLGLALVVGALSTTVPAARVGLLFAGVFGPLAVLSPAATLPAVVAVCGGGGLALLGTLGVPESVRGRARTVVAIGLLAGIVVSLASSVGIVNGGLRGVGTVLALGSLAVLPLATGIDRVALLAGAGGFALLALVSNANPFVVGSALVTGFAVVGVPHVVVALAVAGAVAVAVTGGRQRTAALPIGACLLLLAGTPATLPRAMAVVLGATLVLVDRDAFSVAAGRPAEGSA